MVNTFLKTRWNKMATLLVIGLTAILVILAASVEPALAGNLQRGGFSKFSNGNGAHGGGLPAINGGIAGLSGFRFNFKGGDHHIASVAATFDTSYIGSCEGSWCVLYGDKGHDDPFWYDMGWQELPVGAIYKLSHISLQNNTTIYRLGDATPGTTPVLTGFRMSVNGYTDMHLGQISARVYTENGSVYAYAWFEDDGGSKSRYANISYAEIPNAHIQTKPPISGSSSGKEVSGSLSAQHPVLQGFGMLFWGNDHHIDRLGAEVSPGGWRITFEDKNHDDRYLYWLYWAELIP
ncbi:MAG: hypothetical protein JXB07_17180 [Anaerolineae bacterium]|nr:hypothetical protein [Anaerolineae bacterium]